MLGCGGAGRAGPWCCGNALWCWAVVLDCVGASGGGTEGLFGTVVLDIAGAKGGGLDMVAGAAGGEAGGGFAGVTAVPVEEIAGGCVAAGGGLA